MPVAQRVEEISSWGGRVPLRVHIGGDGPPLVYLHDETGFRWDGYVERLAEQHTVYAPEFPGTAPGAEDAIRALNSLWDVVFIYADIWSTYQLQAPDIVGHSFGGMLAAELAAAQPESVGRMVLIDSLGLWLDETPVADYMIMLPPEWSKHAFVDPDGAIATEITGSRLTGDRADEAMIKRTWALGCTGKFTWPFPDKGLRNRAHRIKAPTLILWGSDDRIAPTAYADAFAEIISDSTVKIIEDSAHYPQLEQLEQVVELTTEFLKV